MNRSKTQQSQRGRMHLQAVNMAVATLAGLVSIFAGVYSLRSNLFQPEAIYGELVGFVRDERIAKPLRMATVEVLDDEGSLLATLSTDENGRYFMKELKEGPYELKASAVLHESEAKNVTVQGGQTSTVYFDLAPVEETKPAPLLEPVVPEVFYPPQASSYPTSAPFSETPEAPLGSQFQQPGAVPYRGIAQREAWPRPVLQSRNPEKSRARRVLVQTGVELLEQWVKKKQQAKEIPGEAMTGAESSSTS